MVEVYSLYLDDSGTRRPTNKPGKKAEHGYDWFALGGVLLREEDEEPARPHLDRERDEEVTRLVDEDQEGEASDGHGEIHPR